MVGLSNYHENPVGKRAGTEKHVGGVPLWVGGWSGLLGLKDWLLLEVCSFLRSYGYKKDGQRESERAAPSPPAILRSKRQKGKRTTR